MDAKPEVEYDIDKHQKIASLMSVDEIHFIDDTGTIYSGSIPKYFGYSFDSGEQMAFFKQMLNNKDLTELINIYYKLNNSEVLTTTEINTIILKNFNL